MNEMRELVGASSPHIRAAADTRSMMGDVLLALLPALLYALFHFGARALLLTGVSAVGCVFWEWLYCRLLHKPHSIGDLSAVVTGVLLAFLCPHRMPIWMLLLGDFFAIVVVKELFGGLGRNFMNPALAGRAFLLGSYAGVMTSWVDPQKTHAPLLGGSADLVTTATPLAYMKSGDWGALLQEYDLMDLFLGRIPGSLGEISAFCLLLGGLYLLWRKVIDWQIPVSYIGTVAALTFLFPRFGAESLPWMLYSVLGGGVILTAFFMATDPVTSPVTARGRFLYGIGCGAITVLIRYFGSFSEGACYSILLMNLFVPLIDRWVKPRRFGAGRRPARKEAAK